MRDITLNRHLKFVVILIFGGLLLAGMSACEGESIHYSSKKPVMLLSMQDTDDAYRNLLTESVMRAAEEEGVELYVEYFGGAVDAQVEHVHDAQMAGYDACIVYLSDPESALKVEEVAGDMPVVFINNKPIDEFLTADQYMFVGSRETDAGKYQAEYVWKKLGHPQKLNLVMLKGEPGHSGTIGRTEAVYSFLEEKGVQTNIVYEDFAYWTTIKAAEKFEDFLAMNQPFEAVFCNNDLMALGVVSVLKDHQFSTTDIPVVGVDGTKEACESIEDGGMQFTVFQSAAGQGTMGIKTAKALVREGTAEGLEGLDENGLSIWVPFEPVDAANVSDYLSD